MLRRLTLSNRPVDEIRDLADRICASGSSRRGELAGGLRGLSPAVTGSHRAPPNPLGRAIGDVAKWSIVSELMERGDEFNLNFALLQVTLTGVIAATARALRSFEVNERRREWLAEVADEYEAFRLELVGVIRLYIRGEGAKQRPAK